MSAPEGGEGVQEYLFDPERVAQATFDYWIQLLRTDKVEGADDMVLWKDLAVHFREDLIEAFDAYVSKPLRQFAATRASDAYSSQTVKVKPIPCYICERRSVPQVGTVCDGCASSHLQR